MAVAADAGRAAAQGSGPDYSGWFDDVGNFDGTVDETGQDEVRITVGAEGNGGGFAFGPAAVRVSPGTTAIWEWSGKGGAHNVVAEDGTFDSGGPASGADTTFEYTAETPGIYRYACTPHETMGMKGALVVEDNGDGGGATTTNTASDISPLSGAVGLSLVLAFLSPLGLAAFLRRRDASGGPPRNRE
jgi:halocyanin-like protein